MQRVMILGGAGFIGSQLSKAYLARGDDVAIVDNLDTGFREQVPACAVFYLADIRDKDTLFKIFEDFQPDIVSHQAAQANVTRSTREPFYDMECNILGSLNILEACVKYKVKRIVYASTGGAVYGEVAKEFLPAKETLPVNPISHYAVSKHCVEHYLHLYRTLYGLSYMVLRYPNVYGPPQSTPEAGVVSIFIRKMLKGEPCTIYGDGTKTRDYVFISDIVSANIEAMNSGECRIINLGSGTLVSDKEVFDAVSASLNIKVPLFFAPIRKGEVETISLDASLAENILGWKPQVLFQDGVEKTANYFSNQLVREQGY